MTPTERYQLSIKNGHITSDDIQLSALHEFDRLYSQLSVESQKRTGLFSFLRPRQEMKGFYLCGGVGIGKTFLMDCFFESLPFKNKIRMHFHQFMQYVHNALTAHQGEKDPLQVIAKEFSEKAMVLCFDELFVSDITDAMLLGRLFKALIEQKVCLVTTSNVLPDDLYKNGLQRLNFLPAIALLKAHMTVMHMSSAVDYRLRHLRSAGVFYTPLNKESANKMEKTFEVLTQDKTVSTQPIVINDRPIAIIKTAGATIWFDFKDLCSVPRSQKDYLQIAALYKAVFISNIPIIEPHEKDTICLFVSMVDVFYDARVKLILSAAEAVEKIYNRGYMVMEYTRTHSRLLEMQSQDYFSQF